MWFSTFCSGSSWRFALWCTIWWALITCTFLSFSCSTLRLYIFNKNILLFAKNRFSNASLKAVRTAQLNNFAIDQELPFRLFINLIKARFLRNPVNSELLPEISWFLLQTIKFLSINNQGESCRSSI